MTESANTPPSVGRVAVRRLGNAGPVSLEKYSIVLTECPDGSCYANGLGFAGGDDALYISTTESDECLASGIKAAEEWAAAHNVSVIYIEREAPNLDDD